MKQNIMDIACDTLRGYMLGRGVWIPPEAKSKGNAEQIAARLLTGYAIAKTSGAGYAQDAERWITVHPNGPDETGRPVLIDGETGEIKAGMGGKFNGRYIDDVPRGKNPHPVKEEKWQARQKRMQEQNAAGSAAAKAAKEAKASQTLARALDLARNAKPGERERLIDEGKWLTLQDLTTGKKQKLPKPLEERVLDLAISKGYQDPEVLGTILGLNLLYQDKKQAKEWKDEIKAEKEAAEAEQKQEEAAALAALIAERKAQTNQGSTPGVVPFTSFSGTQFAGKVSPETVSAVDKEISSGSASPEVKSLFEKYRTRFEINDNNTSEAFYSPWDGTISFNEQRDAKGTTAKKPHSTILHEMGHAMDCNCGGVDEQFSYAYKNNILGKSIVSEGKAYVKKMREEFDTAISSGSPGAVAALWKAWTGKEPDSFVNFTILEKMEKGGYISEGTKKNAFEELFESKIRKITREDRNLALTDMLQSSGAKLEDGHKKGYYKKSENNVASEAFANLTATSVQDPQHLARLREVFPKSVEIYEEMVREMQ